MNRRKPRALPMLLGLPSPSLAKMNRMNSAELQERLERLTTEQQCLEVKLKNLEAHRPRPDQKIELLKAQVDRLKVLQETAKSKLAGKEERRAAGQQAGGFAGTGYRRQQPSSPGPTGPASSGYSSNRTYPQPRQGQGPLGPGPRQPHNPQYNSPRPQQPLPPRPQGQMPPRPPAPPSY